ncbi:MAG: FTR1 family protein, partial [bacterium]
MLSISIIVFREILEVALIVGVLLAATHGVRFAKRLICAGIAAGIMGALTVAFFAETISNAMQGMGQEVFNASVLLLAAILIGWTIVWMRRHGRKLTERFSEVGRQVTEGEMPLYSLSVVTMLALLREGSELVLFTYGVLASGAALAGVILGSLLGLILGIVAGAIIYYGLVKISARALFATTSWLLILLAAGMVSQAVAFLASAGFLPEIIAPVWDASRILPESNWLGQVLHTLLGYSARPSGIQVLAYLLTLGGMMVILKLFGHAAVSRGNGNKQGQRAKLFVALPLTCFVLLGLSKGASAAEHVYSPHVVQGEVEIEARGSYDFDGRDDHNGLQGQKCAVGYGVTHYWFTELYGEIANSSEEDKGWEFEAVEWENRFQLSEPGEWPIDTGLYLAYEFSAKDGEPDNAEGKLLLEKQMGDYDHMLNVILEKEVGANAEQNLEAGFVWSTRYRWTPSFEPGFEWQSDFGELGKGTSFDEQQHQIGPAAYGKIGAHLKYAVGYLFGV